MAIDVWAVDEAARIPQDDGVRHGALNVLTPPAAVGCTSAIASAVLSDALDKDQPSVASLQDAIAKARRTEVPAVIRVADSPARRIGLVEKVGTNNIRTSIAISIGERLPRSEELELAGWVARRSFTAPESLVVFRVGHVVHVEDDENAGGLETQEYVVQDGQRGPPIVLAASPEVGGCIGIDQHPR